MQINNLQQKKPASRLKEAKLYAFNIPVKGAYMQVPQDQVMPAETVIATFGEIARQPICENLSQRCAEWKDKKREIEELKKVISILPTICTTNSLSVLYKRMLSRVERELRDIEEHIKKLQHCLELLEKVPIFTKPTDSPGFVDISALKSRLDVTDVIGRWIELKRSGQTYTGKCPFHDDHSPSFVIYPNDGRWWCFSCSEGGDVITFIQKILNCGFREALAELKKL